MTAGGAANVMDTIFRVAFHVEIPGEIRSPNSECLNSVELITGDFHNPLTSRSQTLDGSTVSCLELII